LYWYRLSEEFVMPLIIAALWGALLSMVGTLVGRVLVSLGIGFATFTGVNSTLDWAKAEFLARMSGAPVAVVQMAGTMKIGVCVSMLLSAVLARLVIGGLTSGSITRMVQK
jgi:hypothetical protein